MDSGFRALPALRLTSKAEIDRRCKLGIEEDDEGEFTTTRLKEFLLDFYGVEYGVSVENGPQSNNQSLSKCFIVICSNSVDEGGACAFDSLTGAWKDVKDDVKNAEKDLVSQGHHHFSCQSFRSEPRQGVHLIFGPSICDHALGDIRRKGLGFSRPPPNNNLQE